MNFCKNLIPITQFFNINSEIFSLLLTMLFGFCGFLIEKNSHVVGDSKNSEKSLFQKLIDDWRYHLSARLWL